MNPGLIKCGKYVFMVLLVAIQVVTAAVLTVSKDGQGVHTSIQAAVNAARQGDEVVILDYATYEEQVTIDTSKNGLTLRSSTPTSLNKPRIKYQDKTNVGPRTCAEAKIDSLINYDQNGALQILGARNVTIDGIAIDGGGVFPFGYEQIWKEKELDCRWPLQHGNAALIIWVSGQAVIRNCDISNAYFGISVKDRNEGGVFANANPGDNQPWNVIPLSGFAKTGNHVIEYNRIHHNSFGLFFESPWDMGSTIRYNLIYKNHHPTDAIASTVKGLTTDGAQQPGGAIMFKDQMLSPLAIYNNTFWHNLFIFVGTWRAGVQHLVFNNIYAQPYKYWGSESIFGGQSWQELMPDFQNRMYNCVLAAQQQAPTAYSVQLMNGMGNPATNANNQPYQGGLIQTTYPAAANNRWLETKFLSTDPTSSDFLVPDWSDSLVQRYIVDCGWAVSGVKDPDGSPADLGAFPMNGSRPKDLVTIRPTLPVIRNGNSVTLAFSVDERIGTMTDPKITYLRYVRNIQFQADAYGNSITPIPAGNIINIPIPATPVIVGPNNFTFNLPSGVDTSTYAFFELIIEGTGSDGKPYSSAVGFLPFRKLDYKFVVTIWDRQKTRELNEVRVGDTVLLRIEAYRIQGTRFTETVDTAGVSLQSGFDLLGISPVAPLVLQGGVVNGVREDLVMFTKIPPGNYEYVLATGKWRNKTTGQELPFVGSSDAIRILPGAPEKVLFEDPPSNGIGIVDPGMLYTVLVQLYDRFDNKTNVPAQVTLQSASPNIGDVVGSTGGTPVTATTDSMGIGRFQVQVTMGDKNDTFPIVTTLVQNGATDQARMVVGNQRDRFWIFYDDTQGFDSSAEIRGCSGERFPVTIRASKDGDSIITDRNTAFSIELDRGLAAYASNTETDTVRLRQASLVNGEAVIWVTSTINSVIDGMINIYPVEDNSILSASRTGIFFELCRAEIVRAAYFADNGFGRVSRVEIYYREPLGSLEVPDSLELFWPDKEPTSRKVVVRTPETIVLDPNDATHITVYLPEPFPENLTYSSFLSQMGTAYWWNPQTPDAPSQIIKFTIADSVGPLLMSAVVVERIVPEGNDTLYISFSETVNFELIRGQTLTLLKNGVPVILNVLEAVPLGEVTRIVVENAGANSPAYGDSLKILASGTIRDQFSNAAHEDNRPVFIDISYIPASIVSSWYEDTDANGIVDLVSVKFDKKVTINDIRMVCLWVDPTNRTDTLMGADLQYDPADSTIVKANVAGKFTNASHVVNKTSGGMDLIVKYASYPDVEKKDNVLDKAAPVLTSASYYPGVAMSDQVSAPDTLKVTFSEQVFSSTFQKVPYLFLNIATGEGYSLSLDSLSYGGDRCAYLVDPNQFFPNSGDSVNINFSGSGLVDRDGNIQDNPANKRVALKMFPVPYTLDIKVGPNPFNPGIGQEVVIQIKPQTKMVEYIQIEATITIFDQLGNKVFHMSRSHTDGGPVSLTPGALEFTWSGHNLKGRKVGSGMYLAHIRAVDKNPDPAFRSEPVFGKKYIGVTR